MQTAPSLDELKQLRPPIQNINEISKSQLTRLQKLATWITQNVGTMSFFLIIFAWTILWLSWNIFAPHEAKFDPAPAFVLWLFISNMIQIFLMPLLLIGQNLQGKYSEARADADFQTNVKAEREIETILLHLENQNEMLEDILKKLKD